MIPYEAGELFCTSKGAATEDNDSQSKELQCITGSHLSNFFLLATLAVELCRILTLVTASKPDARTLYSKPNAEETWQTKL